MIRSFLVGLIGIVILCISSCTKETGDNSFKYHVIGDKVLDEVNFNDLVEDYKYIKLETNENCLLGEIRNILFYDSKIYILTDGLYCFDMEGKFIFAINNKGNGPNEFIRIDEMSIDDNKIYLYANFNWKILCFDSSTGKFLENIKLDYSVASLHCFNGNIFMDRKDIPNKYATGDERVLVSSIKEPTKMLNSYFPEKKYVGTDNQFIGYNKQVYFTDRYFNQVYKIHKDRIEKFLFVDFGKKNLTEADVLSYLQNRSFSSVEKDGKAFYLENVYETDNFITAGLSLGDKHVFMCFDKKFNNAVFFRDVKLKSYQIRPYEFNAVYGNYFCKVVPGYIMEMNNKVSTDSATVNSDDRDYANYMIYKGCKATDNPIIAIYKLKGIK